MPNVIKELQKRGFIDAIAGEELIEKANQPMKVYLGFDPTADSLHLGNLVGIIALKWFEKFGHQPVVLIGGGTGKIGDPSGKDAERPLLSQEVIEANALAIANQLKGFYVDPLIVNNDDWLSELPLIDFLRDVGKHFRMGPMLSKESVKMRLNSESGMSFTEFTYQMMQGYDFYHLFKHHGIQVQLGGSDQWGNIVSGIDCARKMCGEALYGATFPLLTRSDGKKFGKSEEGAIWLNLSPYKFYQYLYSVADADIGKLMRMLTFMDLEEIEDFEKGTHVPNTAQKRLAEEVTRFVFGKEGVEAAQKVTNVAAPGSSAQLDVDAIEEIAADMPNINFAKKDVIGVRLVELVTRSGFLSSKGMVTRLIKDGGAYLNNQKLSDTTYVLSESDLIGGKYCIFGAGKKRKILFVVES